MKCRAKPYLGSEPFVFFSYCHKDSPRVYPLIEQLTALGYRIWFDDGIGIGDEWPEVIAKKLEECTLFLVAITPDYCRSHNCKNEMTYQVEDQKPMLPLMLEDFPLSIPSRIGRGGLPLPGCWKRAKARPFRSQGQSRIRFRRRNPMQS